MRSDCCAHPELLEVGLPRREADAKCWYSREDRAARAWATTLRLATAQLEPTAHTAPATSEPRPQDCGSERTDQGDGTTLRAAGGITVVSHQPVAREISQRRLGRDALLTGRRYSVLATSVVEYRMVPVSTSRQPVS